VTFDQTAAKRHAPSRFENPAVDVKRSGELVEQKQLHGIVEQISKEAGLVLRLPDGSAYRLPPDFRGIQQAPPGTYRLRSTGEEVHDPDFLTHGQ
jgi:hypothetical protein